MNKKDDPILPTREEINKQPGKTPTDLDILPESKSTSVSVDAESKHTPISKEEIKQVDADEWANMSASQLFEQLEILEQRKMYCQHYNVLIVDQIERGIKQLRQLISQKTKDEVRLI